jgi:hypothetical protein
MQKCKLTFETNGAGRHSEGDIGGAKGAKQIAFERGFLDESCKIDGVEVSWDGDLIKDGDGKQVLDKHGKKRGTQAEV